MYRIDCTCGRNTTVAPSQAGGTTPCPECGKELAIPKLGELRQLPKVESEAGQEAGTSWSAGRGALFGLLAITTIACLVASIYFTVKYVTTPPGQDRATLVAEIEEVTDQMEAGSLLNLLRMYEEAGLDPRSPLQPIAIV